MCHLLSGSCQAGPLSCSLVLASHTAPITQNPNSSAAGGRLAHGRPPSRSLLLFSDGRCGASGQCGAGRAPIPQPAPSTPRSHHRLFPWKPRSDSGLWDQLETATQSGSRPGGARRAGSGARSPGRAPSGAEGDAGRGAGREALPAPALPQHPAGSAAAGSAESGFPSRPGYGNSGAHGTAATTSGAPDAALLPRAAPESGRAPSVRARRAAAPQNNSRPGTRRRSRRPPTSLRDGTRCGRAAGRRPTRAGRLSRVRASAHPCSPPARGGGTAERRGSAPGGGTAAEGSRRAATSARHRRTPRAPRSLRPRLSPGLAPLSTCTAAPTALPAGRGSGRRARDRSLLPRPPSPPRPRFRGTERSVALRAPRRSLPARSSAEIAELVAGGSFFPPSSWHSAFAFPVN